MDIITIAQALLRWGIPALIGGAALLLVLLGAYLIYKKVFHGKRSATRRQAICLCLLCCWLILVLGLTALSRGANFTGLFNVNFLSGYISAWNNWSISELQLILFNMLMFAPLGFLLPLTWRKAEHLWVTLAVSLGLTAFIETFQLLTGTGIFELDDLFHNLIGSLFGYFCAMAMLTSIRERGVRPAPVAKALLIPCIICLALGAVFCVYHHQPYGNMSILPAVKQDMSEVWVVEAWTPPEQGATAAVYRNKFAEDPAYIQQIQSALAALEGLTFDKTTRREGPNFGYTGTDADGNAFQMNFFFRNGEWSYTTFAENTAPLARERIEPLRNRYESWMRQQGLLPEGAVFSVQNGDTLRWDVAKAQDISTASEAFQQGTVMIRLDESGALADFFYQISWNEYVATEAICSPSQAYAQVERGNFEQYVPFQKGDTLCVNECELAYVYDTKGFYQPVYQFSGFLNSSENLWVCRIPALQR